MTMRQFILTLISALVILGTAIFWILQHPSLANASVINMVAAEPWQTCRPRAILGDPNAPGYRIDNDVFDGYTGPYCLEGTSDRGFRVLDNGVPDGVVVAYPKVYVGQNYSSLDPQSGLPVRVTHRGGLWLNVGSWGHAAGVWQSDVDAWLWNTRDTAGHGAYEIVIVTRKPGDQDKGCTVRLQGRCWYFGPWVTHQTYLMNGREVSGSWPLIYYEVDGADVHCIRIDLGLFIDHAITAGWLPRSAWLGQIGFGTEVWSGGAGLHDAMSVLTHL
jgi:hypothetical protein